MQYSISGEIAQSARLDFAPGEFAWVSKGTFLKISCIAAALKDLSAKKSSNDGLFVPNAVELARAGGRGRRGAAQPLR